MSGGTPIFERRLFVYWNTKTLKCILIFSVLFRVSVANKSPDFNSLCPLCKLCVLCDLFSSSAFPCFHGKQITLMLILSVLCANFVCFVTFFPLKQLKEIFICLCFQEIITNLESERLAKRKVLLKRDYLILNTILQPQN